MVGREDGGGEEDWPWLDIFAVLRFYVGRLADCCMDELKMQSRLRG